MSAEPTRQKSKGDSDEIWFSVGDVVSVREMRCTVKFIGSVKSRKRKVKGIYVGVCFDEPKGKNDGSVDGVPYFKCPPNHGLFVRPRLVDPYIEPVPVAKGDHISKLKTATQGTSFYRSSSEPALSHEKVVREAFNRWNAIDQLEEQEALSTSREINLLDHELTRQASEEEAAWKDIYAIKPGTLRGRADSEPSLTGIREGRRSTSVAARGASILSVSSLLEEPLTTAYKGPLFDDAPNMAFALALLDHYRENLCDPLPRQYALRIMLLMEQHLTETVPGAVVYFDIPKRPDTQLIIVGDTHGQLNDVLWLFYKFGPPSARRTYLFNGDIADRGRNAVEIYFLLFAFKLAEPQSVLINRGNHESANMNEVYGFAQEVRQKYGPVIYEKFQDIFNLLPLCIIVERRVLVVHGGLLSRDGVTLDTINKINRRRPCPSTPITDEDRLMFDLLWSDPSEHPGRGPSGRGVDCVAFGPDVTEEFLRQNNLDVCIRSHQVPASLRGFDPGHDGRCITLFSASNYCGTSGNYGGVYMAPRLAEVREVFNETKTATAKVARATAGRQATELVLSPQAELVAQAERRAQQRTRRSSIMHMERDMLRKMAKIICEKKTVIWEALWEKDVQKKGVISASQLKECLTAVLGHDIPWDLLLAKLHAVGSDGMVNYSNFLAQFRVEFRPQHASHENWRFETIQQVFESIMKADLTLKETLMIFDRNCDGTVSYREFKELLSELNFGLSEPQVRLLMRIITAHYLTTHEPESRGPGDSVIRIDVAEFLGRFKVIYGHTISNKDKRDPWIGQTLEAVGRYILADKAETAQRHYQAAADASTLPGATITLTTPGSDPSEISQASRRRSSVIRSVALFQKFKDYMGADCPESQKDASGFLSYKDFVKAIRRLPVAQIEAELKFSLDDDKLIRLARAVDVTGSGRINYLEFLNAFYVVDQNTTTNIAEQLWQQICASFFQQKVVLRKALSSLDPDSTGRVDAADFKNTLTALNSVLGPREAPLTPEQIDLIVNSIDSEEDNLIDYNTFLDSFVVVDIWSRGPNRLGDMMNNDDVAAPPTYCPMTDDDDPQEDTEMGNYSTSRPVRHGEEKRYRSSKAIDSDDNAHRSSRFMQKALRTIGSPSSSSSSSSSASSLASLAASETCTMSQSPMDDDDLLGEGGEASGLLLQLLRRKPGDGHTSVLPSTDIAGKPS